MHSRDYFVTALRALCEREGGYREVAAVAHVSADNLWQILNGTALPSGKPRGIGARLAAKLDARFPGWMELGNPQERGVEFRPVAQYLSQSDTETLVSAAVQVPVIGTLHQGGNSMFELRASQDGHAIGFVPSFAASKGAYSIQVFGDELYPAVRHGTCLVIDPTGQGVPGELTLIEFLDGYFLVCELVANRPDSLIVLPASGGARIAYAQDRIRACLPIVGLVSGYRLVPNDHR